MQTSGNFERPHRKERYKKRDFHYTKICKFCAYKDRVIHFRRTDILQDYISDQGKITPNKFTGTCYKHQRKLARNIKLARILALLRFIQT